MFIINVRTAYNECFRGTSGKLLQLQKGCHLEDAPEPAPRITLLASFRS